MAVNTQVSTIVLDFPIHRGSSIGENTGVFAIGTFYPTSKNFTSATIDFGDGTVKRLQMGNQELSQYTKTFKEIAKYSGFFPEWATTADGVARVAAPAFTISHTYSEPGEYYVSATITSDEDIVYQGSSERIIIVNSSVFNTLNDTIKAYSLPENWLDISSQYIETDAVSVLFDKDGFPSVIVDKPNISVVPTPVTFSITNIIGRPDIDYIEWIFDDGSTSVTDTRGTVIIEDNTNIQYTYSLLPFSLSYKPTATLYMSIKLSNNEVKKYKAVIPSRDIVFQDRANVNVSVTTNETVLDTYAFNLLPNETDNLPVECTFISPIVRGLKYIFWNYDDGTYDMIPVRYDETRSFIRQYITHTHTYTSHNVNKMLPSCILYFENTTNPLLPAVFSEFHRARNYLNIDKGLVNRSANYFIEPVYGIDGYVKFNNISILPVYGKDNRRNGLVDVYIRVSLGHPSQILLFEKIIWTVNGISIVHDKNTTKDFGYLLIRNVTTPAINFNVSAAIYGIPAIFSRNAKVFEQVFYNSFSYITNILDYEDWLLNKESLVKILNTNPPAQPPPLPDTVVTVGEGIGEITIETPVIEVASTRSAQIIPLTGLSITFNNLFNAISPAANFLNRDFPSTASVGEYTETVSKRDVGYFTPTQTSNIIAEPGQFTFVLEADVLDYGKPYYFPDPYKYGSNTPGITFICNEESFKNGSLFTIARNRPNTSDNFITFDGYTSVKPINPEYDIKSVVNSGYFHNFVDDIYGNRYGLLKANNFESKVTIGEPIADYTVYFNGYKFFDSYFGTGFNFDYYNTPLSSYYSKLVQETFYNTPLSSYYLSISSNYTSLSSFNDEIIIPGLSTFTGSFNSTGARTFLKFGRFKRDNYIPSRKPFDVTTLYKSTSARIGFRDCASFVISDTELLNDSISSDLSSFSTTVSGVNYYFSELLEAGAFTATPYQRPLVDALYPNVTARFTQSVRVSGDNGVDDVDCAVYSTIIPSEEDIFGIRSIIFDSTINPQALTQYIPTNPTTDYLVERNNTNGILYIKDKNGNTNKLLDALPYLYNRIEADIVTQLLSCVQDFNIIYDTLFIQTSSALVVDKIVNKNNLFEQPLTPVRTVRYNHDSFNKISNRYKVDSDVYFAVLSGFNTQTIGNQSIVPIIYKYGLANDRIVKIYPNNSTYVNDNVIPSTDILFTEASVPLISYNEETLTFNLTYILKDQNKSPTIVFLNFKDLGSDNIITKSVYSRIGETGKTTLFTNLSTLNSFNVPLSSQSVAFNATSMIL